MFYRRSFLAVIFVLAVGVLNSLLSTGAQLEVMGGLGEHDECLLKSYDVECRWRGKVLELKARDRNDLLAALSESLYHNRVERQLHLFNLLNADTTATVWGEPYRRQFVKYNEDGRLLGIVDDPGEFNWVYDPCHPDAMPEGPRAGYVAKPNVNVKAEWGALKQLDSEAKVLRTCLTRLDLELILGEGEVSLSDIPKLSREDAHTYPGGATTTRFRPPDLAL